MQIKKYKDIQVGDEAIYTRTITEKDIELFGKVSGDRNPIHFNEDFAKKTIFKGRIAHGLLTASFISTALAEKLPGPGSIYLKQTLIFKKPVRIGDTITVILKVIEKNDEKKRITLKTTCINQKKEVVLDGEAVTMLLTPINPT